MSRQALLKVFPNLRMSLSLGWVTTVTSVSAIRIRIVASPHSQRETEWGVNELKRRGIQPGGIVGKRREPRNPVPVFFWAKLRKILKIHKKYSEGYILWKVWKSRKIFLKVPVRPKKRRRKKGPCFILVEKFRKLLRKYGKILLGRISKFWKKYSKFGILNCDWIVRKNTQHLGKYYKSQKKYSRKLGQIFPKNLVPTMPGGCANCTIKWRCSFEIEIHLQQRTSWRLLVIQAQPAVCQVHQCHKSL